MSVIKVNGESYPTLDDLVSTIAELEIKLGDMADGTPEHEKLAAHVDALRAAAEPPGSDKATASPAAQAESEPGELPEAVEAEQPEHTHSLRDAADNAKEILCPLCGADIPFPEAPPLDAFAVKCADCDGWGQVLTGSRVDGHVWRNCKGCEGQGFREKGAAPIPPLGNRAAATPEAPGATWDADAERWNPPSGQQPPWAGAVWDTFLGKWS